MFNNLSDRLSATFKNLRGKGRLSDADVAATIKEIRAALLEADVALPVVKNFTARVRERAVGVEVSGALNPAQQVIKIVNEELIAILGGETRRLSFAKHPPTVIMLVGLQGAGKTTLAGKLAKWLKDQDHRVALVAADLQRPNAVDQLAVVAERAGVGIYAPQPGNGVGDPIQVAKDSLEFAKTEAYDIVIIDTAGRLAIDEELMAQARGIRDAVVPNETLFVVDAMIGQDAVNTAVAFNEGVGFDGVVLTKLDGDARGGSALSVREVTGRPVMFASTGEKLEEFEQFHPDRMASRILDMGDMLTLIETAEKAFDEEQAAELARKFEEGDDFTLDDFLGQMQAMKKMGSMTKLMGMMPGMGEVRKQLENVDEKDIDRIAAIIQSMTPQERTHSKIIDGSRRARIAKGAGVEVSAVNNLLKRFVEAQKMMKQMSKGGGGIPGMPNVPGMGRRAKARTAKKNQRGKKGRSGNPAKRAQQAAAEAQQSSAPVAAPGSGLMAGGLGAGGGFDPNELDASAIPGLSDANLDELPDEVKKLLG